MAATPSLGEPEFDSSKAVRDYCQRVRKICHVLGLELAMAGAELEAALGQIPGHMGLMGADSKVRARLVARHMNAASEAQRASAAGAVRVYMSFKRHFAPELGAAGNRKPRKKFDFGS